MIGQIFDPSSSLQNHPYIGQLWKHISSVKSHKVIMGVLMEYIRTVKLRIILLQCENHETKRGNVFYMTTRVNNDFIYLCSFNLLSAASAC